jgi:hypothetical protein
MIPDINSPENQAILAARVDALNKVEGPRVGDFVRFANGTLRRISHHWVNRVQTSDTPGGSYYLGDGWLSYSGSLYPSVPIESLTLTDETLDGAVWFFDRDWMRASARVLARVAFRVYTCPLDPP